MLQFFVSFLINQGWLALSLVRLTRIERQVDSNLCNTGSRIWSILYIVFQLFYWCPQMVYYTRIILFIECSASVFAVCEFHVSLHRRGVLSGSHCSCVLLQQEELNYMDFSIHWRRPDSSEFWLFDPVLVTSVKDKSQQSCFRNVSQCWSQISNLCWLAEFSGTWISTLMAGRTI
jgi:hypothetical protein